MSKSDKLLNQQELTDFKRQVSPASQIAKNLPNGVEEQVSRDENTALNNNQVQPNNVPNSAAKSKSHIIKEKSAMVAKILETKISQNVASIQRITKNNAVMSIHHSANPTRNYVRLGIILLIIALVLSLCALLFSIIPIIGTLFGVLAGIFFIVGLILLLVGLLNIVS